MIITIFHESHFIRKSDASQKQDKSEFGLLFGFIIDQMFKLLVWDNSGSIKLSNRLFGVGTILVKFWN